MTALLRTLSTAALGSPAKMSIALNTSDHDDRQQRPRALWRVPRPWATGQPRGSVLVLFNGLGRAVAPLSTGAWKTLCALCVFHTLHTADDDQFLISMIPETGVRAPGDLSGALDPLEPGE